MCCGQCCVTGLCSRSPLHLDIFIEIPFVGISIRNSQLSADPGQVHPRRVSPKRTTLGATITMAYAAYLHAVDRPAVIATEPVAGLLYDAGIGLPRQPEGGAV
jgi:hypothetical protein